MGRVESYPIATFDGPPTAENLEAAFGNRDEVWSGADNMAPLLDQDGLWFFGGDTFKNGVNEDGTPFDGMTRNSIVTLRVGELTAWLGERKSAPLAASKPSCWLWPASAVSGADAVKVLCTRLQRDQSVWGFRIDGYDVVAVGRDMTVTVAVSAPCDQGVVWNGSILKWGRFLYVHGFRLDKPYGWQVVARTTFDLIDRVPWQYWAGDRWTADPAQMQPIDVKDRPLHSLWVIRHGGAFVGTSHVIDAADKSEILAWRSERITGPYEPLGVVARVPVPAGWMSYAGRVFNTGRGLVAMHSVNRRPGSSDPVNVWAYGLHFADVDATLLD